MKPVALLAFLLAILAISGCATPAPSDEPRRVAPLWEVDAAIVGEPVVRDDMVASYIDDGGRLRIAAWELETGEELWSADALPTFGDPRILLTAAVSSGLRGDVVFYLAPAPDGLSYQPVLAYMRTGKQIHTDWFASLNSHLRPCGARFCFRGALTVGGEITDLELNPADGSVAIAADGVAGIDTFRMGSAVHVETSPAGVELLGFRDDGAAWTRPFTEVFSTSSRAHTEWAWLTADRDPIIGFGGAPDPHELDPVEEGEAVTVNLAEPSRRSVAGLDRSTGATVWTVPGAGRCWEVPESDPEASVVAACRFASGTATLTNSGKDMLDVEFADINFEAIGIDAATGEVLWAVPLGDTESSSDDPSFFQSGKQLILSTVDGAVRVHPETGKTTAVDPSEVLACKVERTEHLAQMSDPAVTTPVATGYDAQPCGRTGDKVDTVTPGFLKASAIRTDHDLWLVAMPGKIAAYPLQK
ncbi:MAG: PQQ-binding-like beta-propeller repeat protein [Salinibacterium sp.]|nr:PQQ-binding-like beta-propeller repeat protein [Salinibacterium sp.]MBF0672467.1 PQQ-binding-like beta-propeller repeat protein [Salinibacterium sp.]